MTIAEVSEKYGMSADTLRYYERIGLLPPIPRDKNGIRNYDDESCNWIEFIRCMRSAGIQIEALIEYVRLFHQGSKTNEARRQILYEQRELLQGKIAEMQTALDRLNYKIDNYDRILKDGKLGKAKKRAGA